MPIKNLFIDFSFFVIHRVVKGIVVVMSLLIVSLMVTFTFYIIFLLTIFNCLPYNDRWLTGTCIWNTGMQNNILRLFYVVVNHEKLLVIKKNYKQIYTRDAF